MLPGRRLPLFPASSFPVVHNRGTDRPRTAQPDSCDGPLLWSSADQQAPSSTGPLRLAQSRSAIRKSADEVKPNSLQNAINTPHHSKGRLSSGTEGKDSPVFSVTLARPRRFCNVSTEDCHRRHGQHQGESLNHAWKSWSVNAEGRNPVGLPRSVAVIMAAAMPSPPHYTRPPEWS